MLYQYGDRNLFSYAIHNALFMYNNYLSGLPCTMKATYFANTFHHVNMLCWQQVGLSQYKINHKKS